MKIRDIGSFVVGVSGNWGVACEMLDWLADNCNDGKLHRPPASIHVDDDKYPISVLAIRKRDRAVFAIDGIGYPQQLTGRFHAIGSGADFALGAMEMGASAAAAVKVAIKWDCYSGGRVREISV